MSLHPTLLKATQCAAIFVASAAGGANIGISLFFIPRLLEIPTGVMVQQWQKYYDVGITVFPPLGTVAGLAFAYLAYDVRHTKRAGIGSTFSLYVAASVLCFAHVPWTLGLMAPTNSKIMEKVRQASVLGGNELVETGSKEESAKYLLEKWGVLNMGRATMMAAGGLLGLIAVL